MWCAMFRDGAERFLVFGVVNERFAVALSAVEEVIDVPPVQPLPDAPRAMLGIATLLIALVTLYDPHLLLIVEGTTRDAAFAPDGRMAFALSEGKKWTITAFGLGGPGELKRERVLARPKDGFRAGTLAFSADGTRVVWRSRSGAARSARLPG